LKSSTVVLLKKEISEEEFFICEQVNLQVYPLKKTTAKSNSGNFI
tara:strand:+ start:1753 stop:1887 length:135 start_codon:yes stop_codon:yes gene_type:complete